MIGPDFTECGVLEFSGTNAAIAKAFVAAQADFGDVVKDKTAKIEKKAGGAYSYTYADLGSLLDAVLPALHKNKIAELQAASSLPDGQIAVVTTLLHESGEWIRSPQLRMKPGNPDPQSAGSAITYARRYSLLSTCGLAAEDDDGKAASQPSRSRAKGPSDQRMDPKAPASISEESSAKLARGIALLAGNDEFTLAEEAALFAKATEGRVNEPDIALLSELEARRLGKLLAPLVEAETQRRALESERAREQDRIAFEEEELPF